MSNSFPYWNHTERELLLHVIGQLNELTERIKKMATFTGQGLAALTQAEIDLTAAVNAQTAANLAATAEITTLLDQLKSVATEDPAVAALAAQIETQVAAIQAANTSLQAAIPGSAAAGAATTLKAATAAPGTLTSAVS